jgi:Tol biopolymer transport system component
MAGEIFISYRRADEAWARLLHMQLRAEGVEAWYDAQVGAGQDWRLATAKALEASQIFVLLFSENAAQSSDIAKELAAAVLEKKLIVPVRLENIAPKGAFLYELASRNWINAYDNPEAKLAEVAKGLAYLVRTGARDESVLPFERAGNGKLAPQQRAKSRKGLVVAVAAVAVIVATAATAWFLWPTPRWTIESSRPFISTLALEGQPAFSPDGKTLAYSSGPDGGRRQIYVRNISGSDGVKIAEDAYDDTWPAWSGDGTHLAYVASKPGEPCHIMVAAVPAGEAREVGRCVAAETSIITWQPNTSYVYSVERGGLKGDIIWRLNLDTGARQAVVRKPALRDYITSLHFSPDGKWLAYLVRGEAITVYDMAEAREKNLGRISQSGSWHATLGWTQDSATILATATGTGGGSEIVAHPLDGSAPYGIYTTAMRIGNFSIANGLLALETDLSRANLARAGSAPAAAPDIVDAANGLTWSPSFAPDGTLAFLSNRSGANSIWIMRPGASPVLLLDGGSSPLYRVAFSPDGTRLAVSDDSPAAASIRILTRTGATTASFEVPSLGLGLPSWTLDGKAVIVFDRRCLCTWQIDAADPAKRKVFAAPHWVGIAMREDGTFSTRADKPGIWRIDREIRQISSTYPGYYDASLAFRGNEVLVPEFGEGDMPRIMAQPVSGGPPHLLGYAPGAQNRVGFQSALAVNPKSGEILYVASVARDTNIDLLILAKRR